ncbi:tetratricopeptide repeat-containing serine protease family protein [Cronbergia sp. UHCC 0137]|uniref:tetratricopeptide repeat-containing serine protease family protein n=1 Tax=Cronbergia sp. UHCC 0137 TaxID=3110239 RepID=UPI002B20CA6D|nr:tetratricopeptide repeat-containing serine protease family protein [Cronbergia sp. UHCC 0137]MEA5619080.1 tetratricopeptide repeat-containing serine protease family protein [Cronbergia sp. UHCC 0137]
MSLYFSRQNFDTILSTAIVAAIVITLPTSAETNNIQEITKIAKTTAVQINNQNNLSPGGSGVIISKKGNTYTVLTANHVVCDALNRPGKITCAKDVTYSVRTYTGKSYPIQDIQVLQQSRNDPDLAIVTFKTTEDYPIATLGNSDQADIASDVFVAGFPAAFGKVGVDRDFSFTKGLVVSRSSNAINGYDLIYDAITITGNSGGPVFDNRGRVIAIHGLADTSSQSKSETGEKITQKTGFNAGIPINTFLALREQVTNNTSFKQDNSSTGSNSALRVTNPQSARDFYARGITQINENKYQESLENFNRAIQLEPKYMEAYFKRGYAYTWLRKFKEAQRDFNEVIKLDPNYLDAYINRGWSHIWLKNNKAALEDFNQAIRINPNYATAYAHQGMAYIRLRKYQEALASSKEAIRLDPNNSYGYSIQGDVFNALNNYEAAIEVSNIAIIINPDDFSAYTNRAIARTFMADYSGAAADYRKASEIFERRYLKKEPIPILDSNLELIKSWGIANVACDSGEKLVIIMIDGQQYCVSPHPSLTAKSYQYDRTTGKLRPLRLK